MKERLGRQDYCWVGSVRNWIWERGDWRAFASTEGLTFEASIKCDVAQAIAAWDDFRTKVGQP